MIRFVVSVLIAGLSWCAWCSSSYAAELEFKFQYNQDQPGCRLSPYTKEAAAGVYIPDINKQTGTAYDSQVQGKVIGDYSSFTFAEANLSGAYFVAIRAVGCVNLMFFDANTSQYTYLGLSRYIRFEQLDTAAIQWRGFAEFLLTPARHMTTDVIASGVYPTLWIYDATQPTDMRYHLLGARRDFALVYMWKLLEALNSNPALELKTLEFNAQYRVLAAIRLSYRDYPVLTAQDREALINMLEGFWSRLSADNQAVFLSVMGRGDGRTVEVAGRLLLDFLRRHPTKLSSLEGEEVGYIVTHPDLTAEMRDQLFTVLTEVARQDLWVGFNILGFLYSAIEGGDGVTFSKVRYQGFIDETARRVLDQARREIGIVSVDSPLIESELIHTVLLPFYARFLPSLLTGGEIALVDKIDKTRLESIETSAETKSLAASGYLFSRWADSFWRGSKLIKVMFDLITESLLAEAAQAVSWNDKDVTYRAVRIGSMVSVMKERGVFNDSRWIFPLLRAYNPRTQQESEAEYAARLNILQDLWTRRRVLVVDYFGGLVFGGLNVSQPVSYAHIIDDFGVFSKSRLDVALLRTQGNTTALAGMVLCVNWRSNDNETVRFFAEGVFHEGGHASEKQFKAHSPWGLLQEYWYNDRFGEGDRSAVVSGYSLHNALENHAELITYWSMDSEAWLQRAISEYQNGKEQLLNQFLIFAQSLNSQTDDSGKVVSMLLSKQEDDGRHSFRYEPAKWKRGSLVDGEFAFNLGLKGYTVTYIGGRIRSISESPALPALCLPISNGSCSCNGADVDSDQDGTLNCNDACPYNPNLTSPGACGCSAPVFIDQNGTAICTDDCKDDPLKTQPGVCGCGVSDKDTDGDGTADCSDQCQNDPLKISAGSCGCGVSDVDTDQDGVLDCRDTCAADSLKSSPGVCGCGVSDKDTDGDGTADCAEQDVPADPIDTSPLSAPKVQVVRRSVEISITQKFEATDRVRFIISGVKTQIKTGRRRAGTRPGDATFSTKFTNLAKGAYQVTWELSRRGRDTKRSPARAFNIR